MVTTHMYQSEEDNGVRIVMSSVQLAAVLTHDTVSEDATFSNRLWGGVRTLGGVIELIGAGALCAAPEPTMATKTGCVVLGVHGSDTLSTGFRQVWSGRSEQSVTEHTSSTIAQSLGADSRAASNIALTVDIAVPIGFASLVGAARVASIRVGRINLLKHEARGGSRLGGHTIAEHIGKTEADLRARLATYRRLRVTSSFSTLELAERSISQGLRANAAKIQAWARRANPGDKQPFDHQTSTVIGHGVIRASGQLVQMTKIRIVLKYETYNNMPYFILTAFPTA